MSDILEILIAPKLDRENHAPIPSKNGSKYKWEYWYIKDYPGHGVHGKNGAIWDENDWSTAINIFEDRIYGRFLNIIAVAERKLFSGFAVTALDCLLCETLQQFYEGVDESEGSKRAFINFLTTSSFQKHFGTDKYPKTSMAGVFYDQIRSGILHMAEVKGTSRIVVDDDEPLVRWDDINHLGLVINRKKFHKQVVQEFKNYLSLLRSQSPNPTMHTWDNFKLKMDFICRMRRIYFAYGSNMKVERLIKRAPSAKTLGRAIISDKQVVFNKLSKTGSGKANIVDTPRKTTWGVLFEIDVTDIPKLDNAEEGYKRQNILVVDDNQISVRAFTYVAMKKKDGLKPFDWYLTLMIQGAKENNLPKDYVENLRKFVSVPDPSKKK
jgi:gamma-glutamylcyclotransferase